MLAYPASFGMMMMAPSYFPTSAAVASLSTLDHNSWGHFAGGASRAATPSPVAAAALAAAAASPMSWGRATPSLSPTPTPSLGAGAHSFDVAHRSEQGPRPTQEDAVAVKTVHGRFVLLGLFDGHAGSQAAEFCRTHALEFAARRIGPNASASECKEAVRAALVESDQQFLHQARALGLEDGTTALLACVGDGWIHIAHLGDSRAVVAKETFPNVDVLTRDHLPSLPSEAARVRQAGGQIGKDHPGDCDRVYPGGLAMTRAVGDLPAKEPIPAVSGVPDVSSFPITPDMKYLVLACDGVWDVVSPKQCAETVLPAGRAEEAVNRLVNLSFARNTTDNVSVVIAGLSSPASAAAPASPASPEPMTRSRSPSLGLSGSLLSLSPGLSLSPASASVTRSPMFGSTSPYPTMMPSPMMRYSPSVAHALQF